MVKEKTIEQNRLSDPEIPATSTEQNVSLLGELVGTLLRVAATLQSIRELEAHTLFTDLERTFPTEGIDFYQATRSYELHLIVQALRFTGGNQSKAASLLNMRKSTLNAIIKRNRLNLESGLVKFGDAEFKR